MLKLIILFYYGWHEVIKDLSRYVSERIHTRGSVVDLRIEVKSAVLHSDKLLGKGSRFLAKRYATFEALHLAFELKVTTQFLLKRCHHERGYLVERCIRYCHKV